MPTFDTPEPISVTVELVVGDVRITASDRTDTVVEVRPSDAADEADVDAPPSRPGSSTPTARCSSRAPKAAQRSASSASTGSVDVTIELPDRLAACTATPRSAAFRCDGRLGECRLKTGAATSASTRPAPLRPAAPAPATSPSTASPATPRSPPAPARSASAASTAPPWSRTPTATPGSATVTGDAAGATRPTATSPSTAPAPASPPRPPTATSASARSPAARSSLETATARLEVGVRRRHRRLARPAHPASAACATSSTPPTAPGATEETVEVRARTSYGDIIIRRA